MRREPPLHEGARRIVL